MFKKIDISLYLRPTAAGDDEIDDSANRPPKHEPTYSALLGFGFGHPKLLKPEPRPRNQDR